MTIENLVRSDAHASMAGPAYFCATPGCEVVYFDTHGGTVPTADVGVAVFQKESKPERPVCYCFEHTAAAVLAATRTDGSNSIVDEVMEACRGGLDRCEETNPQGHCCLGNVRALLRARAPGIEACPTCRTGGAT